MKNNKFKNDSERILELKTCLEQVHSFMMNENDTDKCRTLIKDVLSRYDKNLKFMTAKTIKEGAFEFLND